MLVPPVLCVGGGSGSGKTHLLERVIPLLVGRGLRVGAVKHAEHVDLGPPGKDSARLARAGATPSVVIGPAETAAADAGGEVKLLDALVTFCAGCDLVLAEGYRSSRHDRIFIAGGPRPRGPGPGAVGLVVGDGDAADLPRDDTEGLARWIDAWLVRRRELGGGLIGALLTGGQSSRMGADKTRLEIDGASVLIALYELLADRLGEAWLIGRRPAVDGLPNCARWHMDIRPGLGPLGGIATALRVAGACEPVRGVCVLACDMPVAGGGLLDWLLGARDRGAAATIAVDPVAALPEPLAAIYEPEALAGIEQALDRGRLSVQDWLAEAPVKFIEVPPELARELFNVNTPEDLDALGGLR